MQSGPAKKVRKETLPLQTRLIFTMGICILMNIEAHCLYFVVNFDGKRLKGKNENLDVKFSRMAGVLRTGRDERS